jgi:DNA-binding NtrC family response regulator
MTVLIADDDASIRTSATMLLRNEGLDTSEVDSTAAALARLDQGGIQLALIDMNYCRDTTSGMEGLELISALRQRDEFLPIVVMTGWGSVGLAVEAMRRGAADFVEKPWQNERLLAILRSQLQLASAQRKQRRLRAENSLLRQELGADITPCAESPAMQVLLRQVEKLASSDIPILITGENGCGKGLLARYIHARSDRAAEAFLSINMGGIAEQVFESEMFGHLKGAFTDAREERVGRVELAEGGTLFLDEIANTPMSQQNKLLRLLEEKRYEKLGSSHAQQANVRILSATNGDLDAAIAAKTFRQDLLYRLQGVCLHMPALRQRREDILPLANSFLQGEIPNHRGGELNFSSSAVAAMTEYHWPGNIRELQHVIARASLFCEGDSISAEDMQLPLAGQSRITAQPQFTDLTLEAAERYLIDAALLRCQGNAEEAARRLGLSRSALYRRLEKHGLST